LRDAITLSIRFFLTMFGVERERAARERQCSFGISVRVGISGEMRSIFPRSRLVTAEIGWSSMTVMTKERTSPNRSRAGWSPWRFLSRLQVVAPVAAMEEADSRQNPVSHR
jgi:hypothetical protein